MNKHIPNVVTLLRVFLIIPILFYLIHERYDRALLCFFAAGITDGLDGLLARRFNWISRFGKIVDPLADKVLLISGFLALAYLGHVPYWLVWAILLRDVVVISGAVAYHYMISVYDYLPTYISKWNTCLQIVFMVALLFNLSYFQLPGIVLTALLFAIMTTTVISLVDYVWTWGGKAIRNAFPRMRARQRMEERVK